jgi:hypothetical protein
MPISRLLCALMAIVHIEGLEYRPKKLNGLPDSSLIFGTLTAMSCKPRTKAKD